MDFPNIFQTDAHKNNWLTGTRNIIASYHIRKDPLCSDLKNVPFSWQTFAILCNT